jgi:hypothetical protein
MNRKLILLAVVTAAASLCSAPRARASDPYAVAQVWAHNFAMDRPWHGNYYAQRFGAPTALVVPPTAHMRQTFSWGVSQNLMYPIHHQFGRSATAPGAAPRGTFLPTPPWPSHTDQFGYYYVRGPW